MNPRRAGIRQQLCQLYAMETAAREPEEAQARDLVRRAQSMAAIPMVLLNTHRKVFLVGEVTAASAQSVVAQLLYLEQLAPGEMIELLVASQGGSVYAGYGVIDVMRGLKSPVRTIATGLAASMAAVVFSCGKKGERVMLPSSKLMLHQPHASGVKVREQAQNALASAHELEANRRLLVDTLVATSSQSRAEINELIRADAFLTAERAVELGFADRIARSV